MVSSDEISSRLAARRQGKRPEKERVVDAEVTSKKKCPECGTVNHADAKFCVGCGKSFIEKTVDIKPQDIKENINTKKCPACGAQNPKNAKFCVVCGESLIETVKTEPKEEKTLKKPEKELVKDVEKSKDTSENLVIGELVLGEDGLNFNRNGFIEGLNEEIQMIKYEDINSITFKEESGIKIIEILTDESNIKIKGVDADLGGKFAASASKRHATQKLKAKKTAESMVKIEKAKELLDMGAIDEEEFEKIKRKIMNDI